MIHMSAGVHIWYFSHGINRRLQRGKKQAQKEGYSVGDISAGLWD